MDIVNSFKDDFKLFKYTQKIARVFQVIPVVLYYYFIRYLYNLGNTGSCKDYRPRDRNTLIIVTSILLVLHLIVLCFGPNRIINWLISTDSMDMMAIIKVVLFLVIIVYLVSVIRYIGGLKDSCKEPYIIDNIMVTYSKITLVIYAIVMLICFYIINVLVQEEIKGVYK